MPRVILYPYKIMSSSAKLLQEYVKAQGVRCLRVHPDGSYRPKRTDLIVNWGSSTMPNWLPRSESIRNVLNLPWSVEIATHKLLTFRRLQEAGVSIPEFTTDGELAHEWHREFDLIVRTSLTGHSGQGCYFIEKSEEEIPWGHDFDPPVKLWVKYIKKKAEYRVHVFKGQVIDVQQKRKMSDFPGEIDSKIRSYDRGWVFCREGVSVADGVLDISKRAVVALGLDFGAVDVVWNERQKRAYVLEVNTAPGLEGHTVQVYGDAILGLLE